MEVEGYDIPDSLRCWCDLPAEYSHISSSLREDGKKTVIYKCIRNHRTFYETIQKGIKVKEKKPKKSKQPKPKPEPTEQ